MDFENYPQVLSRLSAQNRPQAKTDKLMRTPLQNRTNILPNSEVKAEIDQDFIKALDEFSTLRCPSLS